MEPMVVYPKNAEQLKTIKAILKALKVPFEILSDKLPPHVIDGIEKSLKQYEAGQTISLQEFKEKHFTKIKPLQNA